MPIRLYSAWFWLIASVSIFCGCGLALLSELWWQSSTPNVMEVHSLAITDLPGGDHIIIVKISGPPAKDCARFTQHLIYRDNQPERPADEFHNRPWYQRDYVPLAMAVNGIGFSSVGDFSVTLQVPPGVPGGRWNYVSRSLYICTVFPGFARLVESASRPYQIDLKAIK